MTVIERYKEQQSKARTYMMLGMFLFGLALCSNYYFFKGTGIFFSNVLFVLVFFLFSVFLILTNSALCAVMGFILLLFAIFGFVTTWNTTLEELSKTWWKPDPLFWFWDLFAQNKWIVIRFCTLWHVPFYIAVLIIWCCHIPDSPPEPPPLFKDHFTLSEKISDFLYRKTNTLFGHSLDDTFDRKCRCWHNSSHEAYVMCYDYEKWRNF